MEHSNNNQFDFDGVGNYWDDFEINPGFPNTYIIPSPVTLVDHYPITGVLPEFVSTPITTATEGHLYTYTVNANSAESYSLSIYPNGMNINPLTGAITWIPDYDQPGQHDIKVKAYNMYGSNSQSFTINVENYITPDLTIYPSDIMFSNNPILRGDTITITAIFHNLIPNTDPDSVRVRFYSGEPSNETLIGEDVININMLIINSPTSDFFAQTQFTPTIEGDYDMHLVIDPLNEIIEENENNNIASNSLKVNTKPDLRIRDMDIGFSDNNPTEGDRVTIMAMVRNLETQETTNFSVRFYDEMTNQEIGETILSLNGLETKIAMIEWFPTEGDHLIHVTADSQYIVDEWDETNNEGIKLIHANSLIINWPPIIHNIPNIHLNRNNPVAIIDLNDYVSDQNDPSRLLTWSVNGSINSLIKIDNENKTAEVTYLNTRPWTEIITFRVEDPEGLFDEQAVTINLDRALFRYTTI